MKEAIPGEVSFFENLFVLQAFSVTDSLILIPTFFLFSISIEILSSLKFQIFKNPRGLFGNLFLLITILNNVDESLEFFSPLFLHRSSEEEGRNDRG